jgi:rhamnulokinase
MKRFLGFDLGASSGRAIVGNLENGILKLDEIHRFSNSYVKVINSMYWDFLKIFTEIREGLQKYSNKYGSELQGIGIDTWGVDFVLLDEFNEPVGPIYCYRDKRTDGMLEKMFTLIPKKQIFSQTGIQFLPINSSTQLFSMLQNKQEHFSLVKTFLMLPDYINFLLSGKKYSEFSIATTSQLFNPRKMDWAYDVIKGLKLDLQWFPEIIMPGTIIGNLDKGIAQNVNLSKDTKIIASLCHDTGSAVAAVPVDMKKYKTCEWAYISSGTWSLMGLELDKPLINENVLKYNFTNEGGINGTIRFLKNITGLWLIQECKKIWDNENLGLSWDDIGKEAEKAPPFQSFIDPNDLIFLNPENMIEAIKNYCKKHNEIIPESIGEISRTIYESLAFKYKEILDILEILTKVKIKVLYIVGGGCKNELLNKFASNALNIPVIAGPEEATAIGNILVQAYAMGDIRDILELREIVRNSFAPKHYYPQDHKKWNEAYKKYLNMQNNGIQ